jgi:hypothetical protein
VTELRLHFASPSWAQEDFNRIQRFYTSNPHNGLSIRDPQALLQAIEDNKALLITDKSSKELVGVSLIFSIGDAEYSELGGVRITKEGYGLQVPCMLAICIHEYMMDPPKLDTYAVVDSWNEASIKGCTRSFLDSYWTNTWSNRSIFSRQP